MFNGWQLLNCRQSPGNAVERPRIGTRTGLPRLTTVYHSNNRTENSLGLTPADVPLEALPVVRLTREAIERGLSLAEGRNDSYQDIDDGDVFGDLGSIDSHRRGIFGELSVPRVLYRLRRELFPSYSYG